MRSPHGLRFVPFLLLVTIVTIAIHDNHIGSVSTWFDSQALFKRSLNGTVEQSPGAKKQDNNTAPQLDRTTQNKQTIRTTNNTLRNLSDPAKTCPSVLSGMTHGHWESRALTNQEDNTITSFLGKVYAEHKIPSNYERSDKKCGNVRHSGSTFRALCDPKGPTPCCYNNRCVKKSESECHCSRCYDVRSQRHAEYSKWVPADARCKYKAHSPEDACAILNGMDVMFVGDALIRHVYTAMLLVVTGNMENGAMRAGINQKSKDACKGMNMFTGPECISLLNKDVAHLCHGKVRLRMFNYSTEYHGPQLYNRTLEAKEKSMIVAGIAFKPPTEYKIKYEYLLPTFAGLSRARGKWPKFIWATHHAFGILSNEPLREDARVDAFCRHWNIPIFNTFKLTVGMMSFDGENYGLGLNVVKANLVLSYIHELRYKENW